MRITMMTGPHKIDMEALAQAEHAVLAFDDTGLVFTVKSRESIAALPLGAWTSWQSGRLRAGETLVLFSHK